MPKEQAPRGKRLQSKKSGTDAPLALPAQNLLERICGICGSRRFGSRSSLVPAAPRFHAQRVEAQVCRVRDIHGTRLFPDANSNGLDASRQKTSEANSSARARSAGLRASSWIRRG